MDTNIAQTAPKAPEQVLPDDETIAFINSQRVWIDQLRRQLGSWDQAAKRVNKAGSTISLFATGKYNRGPYANGNLEIAQAIETYRRTEQEHRYLEEEIPQVPGYFDTPTSFRLKNLLSVGRMNEIVVGAMGPGTGKTATAKHVCELHSNTFLITISPSVAGVNNMQIEVLRALGERDAVGTPQKLSWRIRDRVKDMGGALLIFDEAQHLLVKSIEEIRSWHDATGVGVAFLGNIGIKARIEGGNRSDAYAQLFSRVGLWLVRPTPFKEDAEALAAAWGIEGPREIAFICKIAMLPGGLRGATKLLKMATMACRHDRAQLDLEYLQEAWGHISARAVAA